MACKKPEGFLRDWYMMQRCIQLCRQVRTVMENLIRTRLWVWQLEWDTPRITIGQDLERCFGLRVHLKMIDNISEF